MKIVLISVLALGLSQFVHAGGAAVLMVPTVTSATVASQVGGNAPILNAKADALAYNGGEISATLQDGINALDANFDTSGLSVEQKIQHIGQF